MEIKGIKILYFVVILLWIVFFTLMTPAIFNDVGETHIDNDGVLYTETFEGCLMKTAQAAVALLILSLLILSPDIVKRFEKTKFGKWLLTPPPNRGKR